MLFQKTTAKKTTQNSFCLFIWLQIIHQQFVPTCKHPPCDLCLGTVGRPTGPSTSMGLWAYLWPALWVHMDPSGTALSMGSPH